MEETVRYTPTTSGARGKGRGAKVENESGDLSGGGITESPDASYTDVWCTVARCDETITVRMSAGSSPPERVRGESALLGRLLQ